MRPSEEAAGVRGSNPPLVVFKSSRREGRKESVRWDGSVGGISGHNGILDFSLTSVKGRLMPDDNIDKN